MKKFLIRSMVMTMLFTFVFAFSATAVDAYGKPAEILVSRPILGENDPNVFQIIAPKTDAILPPDCLGKYAYGFLNHGIYEPFISGAEFDYDAVNQKFIFYVGDTVDHTIEFIDKDTFIWEEDPVYQGSDREGVYHYDQESGLYLNDNNIDWTSQDYRIFWDFLVKYGYADGYTGKVMPEMKDKPRKPSEPMHDDVIH